VLRQSFRQSDILARLGGDEFVALVMDASEDSAEVVQRRLRRNVDACNAQDGRRFKLSLSVGIARFRAEQACSIEEMVAQVDARMYEEKRSRRTHAAREQVTQRDPA
jgi:diguanylate cyclase (GGDEF)-like protein